jgi:hypothetical protein
MTENVEKIQELIHDHHWTIHELTDTVGISYGVCQEILTENLNIHHIACLHVPENHRVCDWQQRGYHSPSSLLAGLRPLWFYFVSQI